MISRPRRNRQTKAIRALQRETVVGLSDLVYPLFIVPGENQSSIIDSLPVSKRLSLDLILEEINDCIGLGMRHFILFPVVPEEWKDPQGLYALKSDNFYLEAARTIKQQFPDLVLISDVAMDPYSSDGHDGLVKDGAILNDETLPILAQMAVLQAQAGFDIIGPSDMMDGRVFAIREALDAADCAHTGIMSYTAKYASAYYGPFRDALDSAPKAGDKKTYQMDPANRREALREAELDEVEGADFLMVKPALHYLDIISDLKANSQLPIAAYHVSGECAMLLAACRNNWLQYEQAMPEVLLSIKRAGADVIITYFAKDYAKMLSQR